MPAPEVDTSREQYTALLCFAQSCTFPTKRGGRGKATKVGPLGGDESLTSESSGRGTKATIPEATPVTAVPVAVEEPGRSHEDVRSPGTKKCTGVPCRRLQNHGNKSPECINILSDMGFFYIERRWVRKGCTKFVLPSSTSSACVACNSNWKHVLRKDRLLARHPEFSIMFDTPEMTRLMIPESTICQEVLTVCSKLRLESLKDLGEAKKESEEIAQLLKAAKLDSCSINYKSQTYTLSHCFDCVSNARPPALIILEDYNWEHGDHDYEVDEVSEAHRFIGSGATVRLRTWIKRVKKLRYRLHLVAEQRLQLSEKAKKAAGPRINKLQKKIDVLSAVVCYEADLTGSDKENPSYYNNTMLALNNGGLRLVRLEYFEWAKKCLKRIREGINQKQIRTEASDAQWIAYDLLLADVGLLDMFRSAVQNESLDFSDETIAHVHEVLITYAFNARSEVEWRKYRAVTTDRTAGKENKVQRRDGMKV